MEGHLGKKEGQEGFILHLELLACNPCKKHMQSKNQSWHPYNFPFLQFKYPEIH
jgi:hypothetical protein